MSSQIRSRLMLLPSANPCSTFHRLLEEKSESDLHFCSNCSPYLTGIFGRNIMMNCTKFLVIGTLFAGATASAFASPLTTGTIDIDGTYKVTGSGGSSGADYIANPTSATNGTGILA